MKLENKRAEQFLLVVGGLIPVEEGRSVEMVKESEYGASTVYTCL
jgi:hypothetical protein